MEGARDFGRRAAVPRRGPAYHWAIADVIVIALVAAVERDTASNSKLTQHFSLAQRKGTHGV